MHDQATDAGVPTAPAGEELSPPPSTALDRPATPETDAKARASKYSDLVALAIGELVDPKTLVQGLLDMAEKATVSKLVGKGENAEIVQEADYGTRLRATRMLLEYGAGKPTERKEVVISDRSDEDEFAARLTHPQHAELFRQHLERRMAEIAANQAKEATGEAIDAEVVPAPSRPLPVVRKV